MLTLEEEQHKDEVVKLTEEVLDSKGIECDARIAKISEDQLREILEEVRKLRKRRKRISHDDEIQKKREKNMRKKRICHVGSDQNLSMNCLMNRCIGLNHRVYPVA